MLWNQTQNHRQRARPCRSIIALLQGVKCLWDWRRIRPFYHGEHVLQSALKNELLMSNIKMMAYFDIMCCVPCARPPILEQSAWDTYLTYSTDRSGLTAGPDVVFGYCTGLLPLIGESAALIHDLFAQNISLMAFLSSRKQLICSLQRCCDELPPQNRPFQCSEQSFQDADYGRTRNHNACISAALAHGLATQIFLWRAYSHQSEIDVDYSFAVQVLASLTREVALDTSPATMMLWPMFVLGCESRPGTSLRQEIIFRFRMMLAKQGLMNIRSAYEALLHRIWLLDVANEDCQDVCLFTDETLRPPWTWYCWKEKVELCLA